MCCAAPNWRQYFTPVDHMIGAGYEAGRHKGERECCNKLVVTKLRS